MYPPPQSCPWKEEDRNTMRDKAAAAADTAATAAAEVDRYTR